MKKEMSVLDELNIDDEFKIVLMRISKVVTNYIIQSEWALEDEEKLQHLDCADLFISLIADCYESNRDYQYIMKSLKKDVDSQRSLIKTNASELTMSPTKKPTYH